MVVVCGALWALSTPPRPAPAALEALAARYRFVPLRLPPPPSSDSEILYGINPSVAHLKTWLHPYGASVALGDLDGDGLPNDVCNTDIRSKGLSLGPAPGTGARYPAFELAMDLPAGRETLVPALCRLADLNEDGLTDVLVAFLGRTPQIFLRRAPGDGLYTPPDADAFARQPLVAGPEQDWYTTTGALTDVDGDGHADLVLGMYYPDGSALYDPRSSHPVQMNDSFSTAMNGGRNRIFLWEQASAGPEPTVRYRELEDPFPGESELAWTLAIGAGDLDRDGLSDLYVANDYGPDSLLLNRSRPGEVRLVPLFGEETFSISGSLVLGRDTFKGMGIDFGDLNADGLLDMVVSNIASPFALGESHYLWESTGDLASMERGIAPYVQRAGALGLAYSAWAWDARMDDFDNDGALELVQATGGFKGTSNRWGELGQLGIINDNLMKDPRFWPRFPPETDLDGSEPNPFYVRGEDGRYHDLSAQLFPDILPNTRGIATADVDGDGDLDMAFANQQEDSTFFRNEAPNPGAFLGLHLLLPPTDAPASRVVRAGHPSWREGSPAIGAFVSVRTPDGRSLVRQVDGGNGHTGARSPDLHIGLGALAADAELEVEITWRDREGEVHRDALTLRPGWHTVVLVDAELGGAP